MNCCGIKKRSLTQVHGGFGWLIGHGKNVSLWFDTWLMSDPLCLFVEDIDPNEITWTTGDIIDAYGNWVVSRIKTVLPPSVLQQIRMYHCQLNPGEADQNIWKGNEDGIITAHSFYKYLMADDENRASRKWSWMWKIHCPQKSSFSVASSV